MIIPSYTNVSRNEFNAKHMLLIDQSVAKNISVKHVDFSEISSKTIMVIRGHIGINNDQKPISITFEMLANGCIERVK